MNDPYPKRNAFVELVRGIWFWIVLVFVGSATYAFLSTLPHPWWLISILIIFAIVIFALLRNRSKRRGQGICTSRRPQW
jgi:hypothetical protein